MTDHRRSVRGYAPIGLHDRRRRRELRRYRLQVLLVIALGGVLGAAARFAVQAAFAAPPGAFPWATLIINLTGCLLIGVLMVVIDMGPAHPLTRPFLGVGVLGGYTTFSTYTADALTLVIADRPGLTLVYLVGTPLTALLAVVTGVALTRTVALRHRKKGTP